MSEITVWIAPDEDSFGERLDLPNDYNTIIKAMKKVKQNPENCNPHQCYTEDEVHLFDRETGRNINIFELNYLAQKLSELDEIEKIGFKGLVQKYKKDNLTVSKLINFALNAEGEKGITIMPATNDEELGDFYVENNLLEVLHGIPDETYNWVYQNLDLKKVGEDIRAEQKGFFTNEAYIYLNEESLQELYDGSFRMPKAHAQNHMRVKF